MIFSIPHFIEKFEGEIHFLFLFLIAFCKSLCFECTVVWFCLWHDQAMFSGLTQILPSGQPPPPPPLPIAHFLFESPYPLPSQYFTLYQRNLKDILAGTEQQVLMQNFIIITFCVYLIWLTLSYPMDKIHLHCNNINLHDWRKILDLNNFNVH